MGLGTTDFVVFTNLVDHGGLDYNLIHDNDISIMIIMVFTIKLTKTCIFF